MFDHIHHHEAAKQPEQHIHHHLAPTAEHLRLLNEMRSLVRAEAILSTEVGSNVAGAFISLKCPDTEEILMRFDLNGTKYAIRIPDNVQLLIQPGELQRLLCEEIARVLTLKAAGQ